MRLFTVTLKAKATSRQIVSKQEEQVGHTSTSERTDEQEMNEAEHVEGARTKEIKESGPKGRDLPEVSESDETTGDDWNNALVYL